MIKLTFVRAFEIYGSALTFLKTFLINILICNGTIYSFCFDSPLLLVLNASSAKNGNVFIPFIC